VLQCFNFVFSIRAIHIHLGTFAYIRGLIKAKTCYNQFLSRYYDIPTHCSLELHPGKFLLVGPAG